MIFTGLTGGEIVSLLYPLFILSPFCYIIISKESLDGASCFPIGGGNQKITAVFGHRCIRCLCGRFAVFAALYFLGGRQYFCFAGSDSVRHGGRSADSGAYL